MTSDLGFCLGRHLGEGHCESVPKPCVLENQERTPNLILGACLLFHHTKQIQLIFKLKRKKKKEKLMIRLTSEIEINGMR